MTTGRNTTPATVWDALRRLRACNKQQLAEALGVSPQTLRRWEAGEAGADAHRRAADLLQATLRAANADEHAQWRLNWHAVGTIGGKS